MNPRDLKTQALVLRRTNYGEADRVVRFLTPEGQIAVMAKGVRRARSKLAGGIEMFCLSEITVHQGKSELGVLTSARATRFYQNLLTDWRRLELAANTLKALSKFEGVRSPEFFQTGKTVLMALDQGLACDVVEAWMALRLAALRGEELNLYCDLTGAPLQSGLTYEWDALERALRPHPAGPVAASQIKIMRLLATSPPQMAAKIKNLADFMPPILQIARSLG